MFDSITRSGGVEQGMNATDQHGNVGRLEKLLSLWPYCTGTQRVKTSFHEYNESDETTSQNVLTRYHFNNYAIFTLSTQPEQRSFESTM